MPISIIILMIGGFVLLNLSIVAFVFRLAAGCFNKIAEQHPRAEPLPGAARRNFQTLSIDWCNLGGCVHMTADERHWHLEPSWLVRVFGARAASVPWDRLHDVRVRSLRSSMGTARLGRLSLRAPAWCLRLAAPDTPQPAPPPSPLHPD